MNSDVAWPASGVTWLQHGSGWYKRGTFRFPVYTRQSELRCQRMLRHVPQQRTDELNALRAIA